MKDILIEEESVYIIGDVHGDYQKLERSLSIINVFRDEHGIWYNPHDYKIIFLGDLNDSRIPLRKGYSVSSVTCLLWAKELVDQHEAIVLNSNHHNNLYRAYIGKKSRLNNDLYRTLLEISEYIEKGYDYLIEDIINWLKGLPCYHSFIHNAQRYTCVHAFYTPNMSKFNPKRKDFDRAINGLIEKGELAKWWMNSRKYVRQGEIVIAGHYQVVGEYERAIMLDGGCGNVKGNTLVSLSIHNQNLDYFYTSE